MRVLIDATPLLEQRIAAGATVGDLFRDDIHFSTRGNAFLATALEAWLEDSSLYLGRSPVVVSPVGARSSIRP